MILKIALKILRTETMWVTRSVNYKCSPDPGGLIQSCPVVDTWITIIYTLVLLLVFNIVMKSDSNNFLIYSVLVPASDFIEAASYYSSVVGCGL